MKEPKVKEDVVSGMYGMYMRTYGPIFDVIEEDKDLKKEILKVMPELEGKKFSLVVVPEVNSSYMDPQVMIPYGLSPSEMLIAIARHIYDKFEGNIVNIISGMANVLLLHGTSRALEILYKLNEDLLVDNNDGHVRMYM